MANSYTEGTGTLSLEKVTPVIEVLFSGFNLDKNYRGNKSVYIARNSESYISFDGLFESLVVLSKRIGVNLPEDSSFIDAFRAVAIHFNVPENNEHFTLFESYTEDDMCNEVSLSELFSIAKLFDDGHNLTSIEFETSFYCDKLRLGEFGGSGEFLGHHFSGAVYSGEISLAAAIDKSLSCGNVVEATNLVSTDVFLMLDGGLSDKSLLPSFLRDVAQHLIDRANSVSN